MSAEAFVAALAEQLIQSELHEARQLSRRMQRQLESLHIAKYELAATSLAHTIRKNPRKFRRLKK